MSRGREELDVYNVYAIWPQSISNSYWPKEQLATIISTFSTENYVSCLCIMFLLSFR